ncbi:MAG: oxidoreductase [Paracoccaceae bacterium]
MNTRREFMAAMVSCLPFSAVAQTTAFAGPQGDVILDVDGAIHRENSGQMALFDLAMLDSLPQTTFSTTTIWTEGKVTFSGPTLMGVLDWLEAEPGRITASAANDYSVTLLPQTVSQDFPILATRKNGKQFSIRESGPIWLVYPYDSSPAYRSDLIYSQSVWQLTRLTVSRW